MVFEEALYINGSQRKMLSIEDVTQLATNSLDLYNEIKNGGADNERNKIPRISG